jgi:hydroxymethylglutaryl-CoA lyase
MREKVVVREVGLRDGLQSVAAVLPTELKLEWCRLSALAGVREIEVTSFVPPKVIAQFHDAVQVAKGALQLPDILPSVLVPNFKGAQLAMDAGISKINYVISASEAHNLANVRRTVQESLTDFARVAAERSNFDRPITLVGGIATSLGCSIAGRVPEEDVERLAVQLVEAGADEILLADTVGYAAPPRVERLFRTVQSALDEIPIAAHFHDTRGLGLANVVAAASVGVRRFDASVGGLGGCPFAPGATGNINTEDCAYLLEELGFDTGVDLDRLIALHRTVRGWLETERFHGAIERAGTAKTFPDERARAAFAS